ncbi:MAG: thiol peroxidase [candidate division Zixibacteria bacterium]|nr:thiol peroxidase [candidate division Zixibacteria bacterium]
MERADVIKMKGNTMTLLGNEVKVGDKAPDFTALDGTLSPVKMSSFAGKTIVLVSVPSLDTPVCDMETRRFNKEAAGLGDDVAIITLSMDLPFAQTRWCGSAGVDKVTVLSDYRDASFGENYGVLIKELRLLARTIFVVDKEGIVQYVQYVEETTSEPNYDDVLKAIGKVVG